MPSPPLRSVARSAAPRLPDSSPNRLRPSRSGRLRTAGSPCATIACSASSFPAQAGRTRASRQPASTTMRLPKASPSSKPPKRAILLLRRRLAGPLPARHPAALAPEQGRVLGPLECRDRRIDHRHPRAPLDLPVEPDFERASQDEGFGVVLLHRPASRRHQAALRLRVVALEVVDPEIDVVEAGEVPAIAVGAHRGVHLLDPFAPPDDDAKRLARLAAISARGDAAGAVTAISPEISRASCSAVS